MRKGNDGWVCKTTKKYQTYVNRMMIDKDAVKRSLLYGSFTDNEKRMAFFYLLGRACSLEQELERLGRRIGRLEETLNG